MFSLRVKKRLNFRLKCLFFILHLSFQKIKFLKKNLEKQIEQKTKTESSQKLSNNFYGKIRISQLYLNDFLRLIVIHRCFNFLSLKTSK